MWKNLKWCLLSIATPRDKTHSEYPVRSSHLMSADVTFLHDSQSTYLLQLFPSES